MLARPEIRRCVECGRAYGEADFSYYHGDIGQGPAYWSDRGILCSPACSLAHWKRRDSEGTLSSAPAADPFLLDQTSAKRR